MSSTPTSSIFISAPDGLRLHARCYGRASANLTPVICLPGLTRSEADFEPLAEALSGDPERPRRVIALDYRGRGQSGYDPDPANYNFQVEIADVFTVLTALDIGPAVFIGTSRGGILTMLIAAMRPAILSGAVLNDIGPVIEPQGLMRIKDYVGKMPEPHSFEEAAEILRRLFQAQFPNVTAEEWLVSAHRAYKREGDRLVPTYDVNLAKTMVDADFEKPLPPMWEAFDALAHVPVMVIRGGNSDLLSADTVTAMQTRRAGVAAGFEALEVPDQGHAPLLVEAETIARIAEFVSRCDDTAR